MAQAADDLVVQTTRFFVCCTSHPNLYIACGTSTGPSENLAASCSILLSRLWMHYKSLQRDIQKVPQVQEYPSATTCNQKTITWKSRWRAKGNNRQVRVAQYVWLKFSILACEHEHVAIGNGATKKWNMMKHVKKHVKHLAHHISSYLIISHHISSYLIISHHISSYLIISLRWSHLRSGLHSEDFSPWFPSRLSPQFSTPVSSHHKPQVSLACPRCQLFAERERERERERVKKAYMAL